MSQKPPGSSDVIHQLARLAIGATELVLSGFLKQVGGLDEDPEKSRDHIITGSESLPPQESSDANFRHALIGMAYEMQEHLIHSLHTVDQASRKIGEFVEPIANPLYHSTLLSPFRRHFEMLVLRGQDEVDRWIEIGNQEEQRSQVLAKQVIQETLDSSIASLTNNPQIEELIETQSVSLANEIIEEVRERTVSADTFLESLARALLRRVPRSQLPIPAEIIRKRAAGLHPKVQSIRRDNRR